MYSQVRNGHYESWERFRFIVSPCIWLSARKNFKGGLSPVNNGGNFSLGGGILKVVDTIHWAVQGSRTPVFCALTTFAIHYATALWCDSYAVISTNDRKTFRSVSVITVERAKHILITSDMESEGFFLTTKKTQGRLKLKGGFQKFLGGQKPFRGGQKSFWGAPPCPSVAESQCIIAG